MQQEWYEVEKDLPEQFDALTKALVNIDDAIEQARPPPYRSRRLPDRRFSTEFAGLVAPRSWHRSRTCTPTPVNEN